MEFNDWSDWGHSDWENSWTNNPVSQNFSSQPTPKEQGNTNQSNRQQTRVNQSASGYFENNSHEDDWFQQNQNQNVKGQASTFSMEAVNNNNSVNQIENREVAPPDNKQSFDTSQIFHNRHGSNQTRPNQFHSNAPQVSRSTGPHRQPFGFNNETTNISNYFDPKQATQVSSSHSKPFYSQPTNAFSNHQLSSGPSSFGGSVNQQKFDNEPPFTSLGHQNTSAHQNLSNRNATGLQNSSNIEFGQQQGSFQQQHKSTNASVGYQHNVIQQYPTNRPVEQRPPGMSQHQSFGPPPDSQHHSSNVSLGQQTSASHSINQQHQMQPHYSSSPFLGQHPPTSQQQSTVNSLPPITQQMSSVIQQQQSPTIQQQQPPMIQQQQHEPPPIVQQEPPSSMALQQLHQLPPSVPQQQKTSLGDQAHPPLPIVQQHEQELQQQLPSPPMAQQQLPTPPMAQKQLPTPPMAQQRLPTPPMPQQQHSPPPIIQQQQSPPPMAQQQQSPPPVIQQHQKTPPPMVQQEQLQPPPPMNQQPQQPLYGGQQLPPPPKLHQNPSQMGQQLPPVEPPQQRNPSSVAPSADPSLQPNSSMSQLLSHSPMPHYQHSNISSGIQPAVPNPSDISVGPPSGNQHALFMPSEHEESVPQQQVTGLNSNQEVRQSNEPHIQSGFQQGSSANDGTNIPLHVANRSRFTPSPHLQTPKTSNQPTYTSNGHSQQQRSNSEAQELKTPINHNSNLVNQSAFQSTFNILPPMAASSPLVNNSQYPENEERIPENKEFPDNTENIAQDLKALKINPSRDTEQEAQKHCAIDRNQYLETGQFSAQKENNSYIQNIEVNDEGDAPPPGLHRLVTGQGYEPWQVEAETSSLPGQTGESTPGPGTGTRQSSPLSSIGGESEGREGDKDRRREVPGEAEPLKGRVVLGQVPTPPQDTGTIRGDRGDRERLERMVVGEHGQSGGNTSDDYRQSGRPSRHTRHRRNDSSYEEEERDYSSDRDRRPDDHRRRDDRPRRRREQRSPEYRSDEEFEDRRGYHRSGRESRRMREYSPDRSYYRDYYREEDHRPHRYYPRDYDDYYRENQRSRPSSRSGSDYRHPLKHSMRVLPGHHYYHDPYVSTPSFHDYNLKYSQRTIEYFERMRHVDPAGYAAWYSQYMQGRIMQESTRAFSSDRASVHSGQSSSNQRHGVSSPQEGVDDLTRDEEEVDYTPRLYDCAHIRGNMDGHGRLIVVEPNYPLDQQKATVNLCRLSQVSLDRDSEDFFQSPGPFIPGITHRNTVLQYLKKISDRATKTSEKLLYDLVHMTVKGNGEINGSDVAELLMDSYKNSMLEEKEPSEERESPVSTKEVTTKFRELLQQGNKAEALEWAMDNGAWGHALFLASKMGEKTHNDIMLRFANSIPHNDPLQTLYQLMSGYIPQAATCCADKKWSDWRPHLAMILSNPTGNIDLDRQAIITLGDSLYASGRLFASHFCYVTAQVEFSQFQPDAKLVLLGSSHSQDFSKFATCRAIMLTMCYEYGLKLRQPNFNIPTLQVYKVILAARLTDSGRIRNALQYCELLAQEALARTSPVKKSLISTVIDFSSRLKMLDPVVALSGNTDKDPDWLYNLKQLHDSLPDDYETVSCAPSPLTVAESNDVIHQDMPYQTTDSQPNSYMDPSAGPASIGVPTYPMLNQTSSVPTYQPISQPIPPGGPSYQPLGQSLSQLPQPKTEPPEEIYHHPGFMPPTIPQSSQHTSLGYQPAQVPEGLQGMPGNLEISSGPESSWEPRVPSGTIQPPTESIQPQRNSFFKATEEQLKLNEVGGDKKKDGKQPESKPSSKNDEQRSGWFDGIWEKIALRPKNQMRLPDDSNPSIIWDEKKKRWVNLDGDSESSGSVKPPPKINEALPPQGNKYKIQKGKLMKSNYVDVMGNKEKDSNQANFMPSTLPPPVKTNFFIPQPVEGNENAPIDFITPAPNNPVLDTAENHKQQLSRSSSVSSLSREVQYYMAPPSQGYSRAPKAPGNAPAMYNSSRFPS